jgi:hypothetical protein
MPGTTYCFSVRSTDAAGNVSSWTAERCAAVPLDDRAASVHNFTRSTGSGFYQGTVSVARVNGAYLWTSKIRARSLAVLVQMCSTCRYVDVYWNGSVIKKMALTSNTARMVDVPLTTFGSIQTGTLSFVVRSPNIVIDAIGASQV